MTTPKHSPTPWETHKTAHPDGWISVSVAQGGTVAFALHKDDADFITRAANSHKDLVDALKVMVDRFSRVAKVEDMSWIGGARDVIDRAEGRTS